ncbi:acetyl-CoA acetyltransferase [Synergistales bacterium]|nr:acetyl-CoA acetyltransferase [Synergistales bacterium]
MKEVVIVSAARTPIGSIGGTLKNIQPEILLRIAMQGAIDRAGIAKGQIDEVIAGQAKQSTDAPNIARVASLALSIPEEIPSYTVHRQCASGMQAVLSGVQQIQCGYSDTVLCGGVESMSTAPFYIRGARFGVGSGNTEFIDPNTESQPRSQPSEIYGSFTMINTADNVARKYGVTREDCDEFALESQSKAIAAIDSGRFKDEIVPVVVRQRKGEIVFDTDEFPKRDTSLEKMAKLKPVFPDGLVTAGNASGRNDGAAALVIMAAETAEKLGLKPLARIMGGAAAGVDPRIMGIGPVAATRKLMERSRALHDMKIGDFGLIEINEAFAAQSVACVRELGLDSDRVNVNGGAIALGHPLGCSGARILTTLVFEMQRRDVRYGLAAICIAGGLGMAMAIEKL